MMFMNDSILANQAPLPMLPLMAGIAILTGLFMLVFGRRVLRIGLGVIGASAGGLCGNFLCSLLTTPPPPLAAILIGAVIGFGLGSFILETDDHLIDGGKLRGPGRGACAASSC